jgi:Ser/Thr protein kinase RdoA (MazF antagonist)
MLGGIPMLEEGIINKSLDLLGLRPSDAICLGGYNDNVFEVGRDEKYIIKILEQAVTPESSLRSELELIDFLHNQGIRVPKPRLLNGTDYVMPINDLWYLVAFEKVNGTQVGPDKKELWDLPLFRTWGEEMGKLHFFSRFYKANNDRPKWLQNPVILSSEFMQHLTPQIKQLWVRYKKELEGMPSTQDEFGLVHGDFHFGNLLVTGSEITLIDFGDSEYHWFAYDIAVAVYHAALSVNKTNRDAFAKSFFGSFMEGYNRWNPNTFINEKVEYFINYRQLYSYTYHLLYAEMSSLSQQQLTHLREMERSLTDGLPFLNVSLYA